MSDIKLKIDIKSGTIDIEADKESFETVSDKAGNLLDKFAKIDFLDASADTNKDDIQREGTYKGVENAEGGATKTRRKRSSGSSKPTNWKMIDNLLDEEGRGALKAFFDEKKPNGQNEQVAVLTIKLKELTGRDEFDGNEVHTAFQIVGKKTPGNINAVFGNMTSAGLGSHANKKFKPNFKASDLVRHDLPGKGVKK